MAAEDWIGLLRENIYHAVHSPLLRHDGEPYSVENDGEFVNLTCQELGVSFRTDDDARITSIFLHREGHHEYAEFKDALPHGLAFENSLAEVHEKLGEPTKSRGATEDDILGWYPPWERFDGDDYCLHIEYADTEKSAIRMITIMTPEAAP